MGSLLTILLFLVLGPYVYAYEYYQEPHAYSYNNNATPDLPANFSDNLYPRDYSWNGTNEKPDQPTQFSFYCRNV